jgi:hypothetical protein
MATEQATTWICDRCGVRFPYPGQGLPVPPDGWHRRDGMDLCAPCWRSYCDWLRGREGQ